MNKSRDPREDAMSIKNLMEDVVHSTIEELLKEEKYFSGADKFKQDIEAYVLNRIPPKYITSERGILHGKLEARFLFQQKSDIIFLVHEALGVIKGRRETPSSGIQDSLTARHLFFPHILGEVLEETTFSVIQDVEVTLLFQGAPAKMIDTSWANPYCTNKGTLGYYHFWPDVNPDIMDVLDDVPFTIRFHHPKFHQKDIEISVPVLKDARITQSRPVPLALLELHEGEDISFLYV